MLQSYTEHVKRYGIAELVFRGPSEGNPSENFADASRAAVKDMVEDISGALAAAK